MTDWFASWFNTPEYLELYRHRDEHDANKIISLINQNIELPENANVLDLACGNGRHSILFAETGHKTTGIDLSPFLISEANKQLDTNYKEQKTNLRFEIKDMRYFSYPNEFDLIVNLFSSFGYFDNDKENELVIKSISESLKKDGHFIIDFLNAFWVKKNLVPMDIKKINDFQIIQVRQINNKFVFKDIIIKNKAGRKRYREQIRLFDLNLFAGIFKRYKLKINKVFGDYEGNPYDEDNSSRMIIFTQKIE